MLSSLPCRMADLMISRLRVPSPISDTTACAARRWIGAAQIVGKPADLHITTAPPKSWILRGWASGLRDCQRTEWVVVKLHRPPFAAATGNWLDHDRLDELMDGLTRNCSVTSGRVKSGSTAWCRTRTRAWQPVGRPPPCRELHLLIRQSPRMIAAAGSSARQVASRIGATGYFDRASTVKIGATFAGHA